MTYEIYRYIFIGAAILCGIMLIVSVLLFILLRIPRVIGDLTGATARKAIANIRNQNESSGDKIYKSSSVNKARGKLTDKISASGNILRHETNPLGGAMATAKIATQGLSADNCSNETTVLGNETTVLSDVDISAANDTTVLESGSNASIDCQNEQESSDVFEIEYEITFVHTDEVIE